MRTLLPVLLVMLTAAPLRAAEIEAGAQHVVVMAAGNGELEIDMSRGFGAHVEVFWSDAISTRAAGTFVNPAVFTPEVDLGTLGLDLWSATARWHLAPRSRLSAFAGAGGTLAVFGNLDDQFGDQVEIEFDPELAPLVEAGLRYRLRPRIILELGATYIPLEAEGNVRRSNDPRIPSRIAVDPLIVSAGAAWRF